MYENDYLKIHENIREYNEDVFINTSLGLSPLSNIKVTTNQNLNDFEVLVSERINKLLIDPNSTTYNIIFSRYKVINVVVKIKGLSDNFDIEFSEGLYNSLNSERFCYVGFTETLNIENIKDFNILNESAVKPLLINKSVMLVKQYIKVIVVVLIILVLIFSLIILYLMFNEDKKIIGIKRTLGVSKLEIYSYYFLTFLIIGVISVVISFVISITSLLLYDYSFKDNFNFFYLKIDLVNIIYLVLSNLLFLNIVSIPYLINYLNKNETYLIKN